MKAHRQAEAQKTQIAAQRTDIAGLKGRKNGATSS
jgi:hypothetical protein